MTKETKCNRIIFSKLFILISVARKPVLTIGMSNWRTQFFSIALGFGEFIHDVFTQQLVKLYYLHVSLKCNKPKRPEIFLVASFSFKKKATTVMHVQFSTLLKAYGFQMIEWVHYYFVVTAQTAIKTKIATQPQICSTAMGNDTENANKIQQRYLGILSKKLMLWLQKEATAISIVVPFVYHGFAQFTVHLRNSSFFSM